MDRFAILVALALFSLTWPVLELLAGNAEFFLARHSSRAEIWVVAVGLIVVLPAILGGLGSLPGTIGRVLFHLLLLLTCTALAFLVLRRLSIHWGFALALATAAGIGMAWAFVKFRPAHQTARYLLLAPIATLAFFLLATPAGAVLLDGGATPGWPVAVENPVPVVLVVFDEFPVASIIDPNGNLRAERFPNLARLGSDGVWFRNAVTVAQQTEHSLPAILTGAVPNQSLTPYAGQYPNTLFTALQESHQLRVHEPITELCPARLCERAAISTTPIAEDLGIVAGHVLLPPDLSDRLPPIESGWGDFAALNTDFNAKAEFREAIAESRIAPIDAFIEGIRTTGGDQPPLHFLHVLIPHHPWEFLPDGRSYPLVVSPSPGTKNGGWSDDEFLAAQGMQRHLLQVGYADHLVGRIIEALEDRGIYDDALVVVVADHGISIKPGVPHQRKITETTIGEIAAVPLFVKPPGSHDGRIDDRRALTTDIVPTIAQVIGAEIPWGLDGASLLGPAPGRESTTTIGPERTVTYGVDGHEKLDVARRLEEWFPGGDPWQLRPEGSPDLLGQEIDLESLLVETRFEARLVHPEIYNQVDVSSGVVPVRIGGWLTGGDRGTQFIGIVVNGEVAAITRTYAIDGTVRFLAMVPPDHLVDGRNTISLLEVLPDGELILVEMS